LEAATIYGQNIFPTKNFTFSLHLIKFFDRVNSDSMNIVYRINLKLHFAWLRLDPKKIIFKPHQKKTQPKGIIHSIKQKKIALIFIKSLKKSLESFQSSIIKIVQNISILFLNFLYFFLFIFMPHSNEFVHYDGNKVNWTRRK